MAKDKELQALEEQLFALEQEKERLATENASLRKQAERKGPGLSLKVGVKGGLSVYGLGRYPVSLYAGQWEKLFDFIPTVKAYIAEHPELKRKNET